MNSDQKRIQKSSSHNSAIHCDVHTTQFDWQLSVISFVKQTERVSLSLTYDADGIMDRVFILPLLCDFNLASVTVLIVNKILTNVINTEVTPYVCLSRFHA